MRKNRSLKSLLWNIYGFAFFNKFLLLSPIYAIFMQDNGISAMQLSVIIMLMPLTTVISQIPTIWIINKIGQRNSMLLGQSLKGIGFITWLIYPTFLGFAAGMCLWGIMSAFYNTAFESMTYDELSAIHQRKLYARVLGNRYNAQAFGSGLAACGSLLAFMGYEWITLMSLISLLLSMFFMWRIKPRSKIKPVKTKKCRYVSPVKLFRTSFRIFQANPCVFSIMILCLLVVMYTCLDEFLSPVGLEIGIPVMFVGSVRFFILGCTIIGQTLAYRFVKVKNQVLYSAICSVGLLFVLFAFLYSVSGLWALCFAYILGSGLHVLLFARFQDSVPASYRTVILSLYSMAKCIFYGLICLLIGLGGTLGSWRYSIQFIGIILVFTGVWAFLFIGNHCSVSKLLKQD